MTIGIDVDDTITKTTETICSIPGMSWEILDQIIANPSSVPNLDEQLNETFGNMDVFENVVSVINYFKDKGYKIVIITARGSEGLEGIIPITEKLFKKIGLKYDKAVFSQNVKGNACKENNVDIFIDDTEEVLDEIASKGIKTVRFSESDINSKHKVMHSWLEFKEYIDSLGDNYGTNN